jgi:hypothetical protein
MTITEDNLNTSEEHAPTVYDNTHEEHNEFHDGEEGLQDIPIETGEASLPHVDDVRVIVTPPPKDFRRIIAWFMLGVVLFFVIIGVSVGVSRKNGSKTNVAAPPARKADVYSVITYLAGANVTARSDLEQTGSPQNLAATWLATQDGSNLAVPNVDVSNSDGYRYMTRYVMATLWYSLGGSNWTNQFDFLSSNDHCYWNAVVPVQSLSGIDLVPAGVFCDSTTMQLLDIQLCKFIVQLL